MSTFAHMTSTHIYDAADDLLPIGDAARILGVSVPTIRRWEAEGKLTGSRTLGGQRRFRRADLEAVKIGRSA